MYVNIILVGNFKIRLDIRGRKLKANQINKQERACCRYSIDIVGGAIYGRCVFIAKSGIAPGGVTWQ